MPPSVAYGASIAALLDGVPPAALSVSQPNEKFRPALAALTPENLLAATGKPVRDREMARCCLAGLWLRHDFFDESHALSQDIATPSGSFWHAILHRREPDYGNARYWFRRVGAHPIFSELNQAVQAAGWPASPKWDASALVDAVEKAARLPHNHPAVQLSVKIQQLEWELLFAFCWQHAVS
jgi:hypothetical protein